MVAAPEGPLNRGRHDAATIARMRRERVFPRPGQWDELHLDVLRQGLSTTFERLPVPAGPVLDLWCGTKPYEPFVPGRVIGVDLDLHFGSADVVAAPPLPFADGTFSWAVCTQALHIVDDEQATVDELRRTLRPGGYGIVTVPDVMLRKGPSHMERRLRERDLRRLFAEWEDVRVEPFGGPGAAFAHGAGLVAEAVSRRVGLPGFLARPVFALVNLLGRAIEVVSLPVRRRFPHLLIVTARVPSDAGGRSASR